GGCHNEPGVALSVQKARSGRGSAGIPESHREKPHTLRGHVSASKGPRPVGSARPGHAAVAKSIGDGYAIPRRPHDPAGEGSAEVVEDEAAAKTAQPERLSQRFHFRTLVPPSSPAD